MNRRAEQGVLLAILAVAAWIRLWGLTWGLPHIYHPDEGSILVHSLGFGTGDLNPHWFRWPSLFMYIMFAIYVGYFAIGRVTGTYSGSSDFLRHYLQDPTPFWFLGRLMSAAAGVATVWLVYVIARRTFGRSAGLVAAALMAVVFLHVRDSHYATPDVLVTLLAMVSLLLAIRACESGSGAHLVASCLLAGLSASAKYPGVLAGAGIAAAFVAMATRKRAALWMVPAGVAAILFGFVVGTPYSVLSCSEFLRDMGMQFTMVSPAEAPQHHSSMLASAFQEVFSKALGRGVGWLILVLSVVGAFLPIPRNGSDPPGRSSSPGQMSSGVAVKVVLIPYVLCVLVAMSLITVKRSTYLTPIVPAIVVLASLPLARVLGARAAAGSAVLRVSGWVLLGLAIASTAVPAIRFDMALGATDTRTQAKMWVESNLPPGSRVAVEDFGPPLNPSEAQLLQDLEIDTTRVGSWRAAKRGLNQMKFEVGRARRPQFEVYGIGTGLEAFQLPEPMRHSVALEAELEKRDIHYVILSSKAHPDRPMDGTETAATASPDGFTKWLRERAVRITRFIQDRPVPPIDRGPGHSFHSPVIEVFEIQRRGS